MTKNLRNRFAPVQTKITDLRLTGRKSAQVDYVQLDAEGEELYEGTADCFDIDAIEIDDNDNLTGDSMLSASGELIVQRKAWDRTGLGPKAKAVKKVK